MTARSTRTRILASVAAVALGAVSLAGCAKDSAPAPVGPGSASGDQQPRLIRDGTLLACTHTAFVPFEYPEKGKIVGFDIDLAEMVAKKVNAAVEVVDIPFEQITSGAAFAAKRCDLGAAAITMNEKRRAAVSFSDPYFESTQALLTKKGAAYQDLASLNGKKLGVQTDTTGKEYAEKNREANGYELVIFEDSTSVSNAVLSDKVDAGLNDNSVMLFFAKNNAAAVQVAAEFATGDQYGLAVAKDNPGLLKAANEALAGAKSDGTFDAVYQKYFGTTPKT